MANTQVGASAAVLLSVSTAVQAFTANSPSPYHTSALRASSRTHQRAEISSKHADLSRNDYSVLPLGSIAMGAAAGTAMSALTLTATLRRAHRQKAHKRPSHLRAVEVESAMESAAETRASAAEENAAQFDFSNFDDYNLAALEELYIDALWCYYREKRRILDDKDFDKLKQTLYQRDSRFPTLKRQEVAFVEASIAYYRGEPVVSDEEYEALKAEVKKSGARKEVTAFLLYERGQQFLDEEQYASMKDEYEKLGLTAVNLDQCTVAQLEEMYVDALWSYYKDGVQLLTDDQYTKLKEELNWQGSGFPTLRRYEVDFVKASLAYWRGEPVASDEEWKKLKKMVLEDGKRKDVTAFLLYSKGKEALDPETFEQMKEEMAKMGVSIQKAGTKALEQTLSITTDRLENDIGQVFLMITALGALPTVICTALAWALGIFLDFEFVPDPQWESLLKAEVLPLFGAGIIGGLALTYRLLVFLDLQSPQILVGVCPSCSGEVKLFNGGAKPNEQVEYACKECGCKMVLDVKRQRISAAGLGAKIADEEDEAFDWSKAWRNVKDKAKNSLVRA